MPEDDPLEDLYVDETEINKERIRNALKGIIGLKRESGDAVFLSEYSNSSQQKKVLAYLLYRRVALEKGHIQDDELGITGSNLEEETGVPDGTFKPFFKDLAFVVNESEKGGYFIPDYGISEAIDMLEED